MDTESPEVPWGPPGSPRPSPRRSPVYTRKLKAKSKPPRESAQPATDQAGRGGGHLAGAHELTAVGSSEASPSPWSCPADLDEDQCVTDAGRAAETASA